jgi:hypothetical protein
MVRYHGSMGGNDVGIEGIALDTPTRTHERSFWAWHADNAHDRKSADPHPHARSNGDHHRCLSASAATAAFSIAASTVPVIRIRAPAANSISIAPLRAAAAVGEREP